ncbi:ubiquitin-binding SDF ubiquitin ligase complex subunit met30 [Coemansia interrupta]|uniref:Ubiquitin-binding SDF ubiquitin ligase complex subunit met30 n=1 Tax=Coemansia interrupta TaxID=1126814 RepID=A0A9W8LLN8_9FUNG|nr:ubiquitin-binding SDF ubiquitin ligase complex subunit met30 [Coemansia interrupta]
MDTSLLPYALNSRHMAAATQAGHANSQPRIPAEEFSHDRKRLFAAVAKSTADSPATSRSNGGSNESADVATHGSGRKRDYSEYVGDASPADIDILSLRKYPAFGGKCYRHSAHVYLAECTNTQRQLQESLVSLPADEQAKIGDIWRSFASEPSERRLLILQGIVNLCCIPQLSYLNKVVPQQLRVDFLAAAPPDISLKILSYLDARSLCVAAQVSRTWAALANEDILWHRMCAQHIDKVCKKCGWGLPLLDKSSRRVYEATARRALQLASNTSNHSAQARTRALYQNPQYASHPGSSYSFVLPMSNVTVDPALPNQQQQQRSPNQQMIPVSSLINTADLDVSLISSVCAPQEAVQLMQNSLQSGSSATTAGPSYIAGMHQRKAYATERDNESGNISDSSSHSSGENASGGHRSRRRPWKEIFAERQIIANNWRKFRFRESQIRAHADGILCVQFNDAYMITGSYDSKVHVWDAETFGLVSELTGHTMPVRALEFDDCKLFSGSLDGTVKIWNYRDGTCIRTLRVFDNGGVISLHHQRGTLVVGGENGTIRVYNIAKMTSFTLVGHTDWVNAVRLYGENTLFSCSDDMLIKRWDLEQRQCVRTYTGHTHHVQSLHLSNRAPPLLPPSLSHRSGSSRDRDTDDDQRPFMITGSLDGTMRVWDIETGECLKTIFGHVEGIWSMTFDSLRIVSGSNDGVVKIWDTPNQANYEVVYFPQNMASANSYDMANMLCMVNNLRKAKGLVPVVYHGQLLRLAKSHAQFQSRYRVVTHADNAGQIGDRLSALGFEWDVLVENVGAGVDNDTEIVNAWAKSPNHLHNILNPDVRFMGVDVSSGYWVQDFASPRDKSYVVPTTQIDACPNQYNLQIYN